MAAGHAHRYAFFDTTADRRPLKGPLHAARTPMYAYAVDFGQDVRDQKIEELIGAKLASKRENPRSSSRLSHGRSARDASPQDVRKSWQAPTGDIRWFQISQRIEQIVKADKKLNAKLDFYSRRTYYYLGIPIDLFTPVFAVSRISG